MIPIIVTPINGNGGIVGVFSTTGLTVGNNSYTVNYYDNSTNGNPNYDEVALVSAAPEPGSLEILALGGGLLLRRRRISRSPC